MALWEFVVVAQSAIREYLGERDFRLKGSRHGT